MLGISVCGHWTRSNSLERGFSAKSHEPLLRTWRAGYRRAMLARLRVATSCAHELLLSPSEAITFREALDRSKRPEHRHLLLGNGFSIALFPKHFSYQSIFDGADIPDESRQRRIFDLLKTRDFEYTISRLEETQRIVQQYDDQAAAPMQCEIRKDVDGLKHALVGSIAENHPDSPILISESKFTSCKRFLHNFIGEKQPNGRIYTVNYDLLLYWTLMQETEPNLGVDDGFRNPQGRVIWDTGRAESQNIHYLHGALHLRESGEETEKVRSRPSNTILPQVTKGIHRGEFPLFVTEGEHKQKLSRIARSPYLRNSYLKFRDDMRRCDSCLFTLGHSLSDVDQHILDLIANGTVSKLFIGVYGLMDGEKASDVHDVISRGKKLAERRPNGNKLDVEFYHASSARIWKS